MHSYPQNRHSYKQFGFCHIKIIQGFYIHVTTKLLATTRKIILAKPGKKVLVPPTHANPNHQQCFLMEATVPAYCFLQHPFSPGTG